MPATGRVLLDTNILIALLAEEPAVVRGVQDAEAVHVPAIALGELYYGARKSARARDNVQRVSAFAAASAVLSCDAETAAKYGELKAALRAKGTPIPENDLWIAALARQPAHAGEPRCALRRDRRPRSRELERVGRPTPP